MKTAFPHALSLAALALSASLLAAARAPLPLESPDGPAAQETNTPRTPTDPVTRPAAAIPTGPSAIINTVAGDGLEGAGGYGGLATNAEMYSPAGIAFDSTGNTYIADSLGQVVLKITASTGKVSVFAGTGESGYSGDNGPATKARLNMPSGIAFDPSGNLLISDTGNSVIRIVNPTTGVITTYAGDGRGAGVREIPSPDDKPPKNCDAEDGSVPAGKAPLCAPKGIKTKAPNECCVKPAAASGADSGHAAIPETAPSGLDIFFVDSSASVIRKFNTGTGLITTVAGNGNPGYSGDGGLAVNAELNNPSAIDFDSANNLYIADTNNCTIRMVKATTGIITSLVGAAGAYNYAICGLAGDGGPASAGQLNKPQGVAVDVGGNVFIADTGNSLARMIAKGDGNIYSVAGSFLPSYPGGPGIPNPGYSGDGGPAGFAQLTSPTGITIWQPPPVPAREATGPGIFETLYIADQANHVVRAVTLPYALPSTEPVITPAGTGPYTLVTTPVSVTITAPVKGSVIYYTEDGSIPSVNSTKYTGQINLEDTASVTAFATVPNEPNSPAVIANYFNAPAPTFNPPGGTFAKPTKVTITDGNPKAQIYYSAAGPNASFNSWQLYTGPITVPVDTYLQASAFVTVTDFNNNVVGAYSPNTTASYENPKKPVVVTRAATLVNPTFATLNATITPNSANTEYSFYWGTSPTSLPNFTGYEYNLTGTTAVPVSRNLTGLMAKTTYYFQAVATSDGLPASPGKGAVLSFTTPAAPAN